MANNDNYRPIYHSAPASGWLNDPNGLIWHEGFYHVFYQHNPRGDKWGNIHWGHMRSADLVKWEHLPLALIPSADIGEEHCFSGCAVSDGGVPTIFYTSIGPEHNPTDGARQFSARSGGDMINWAKSEKPVIDADMPSAAIFERRDPFVWRENGLWKLIIGGQTNGHGAILAYSSENLRDWRYDGIFFEDFGVGIIECPNVAPLGGKTLLFYSPASAVVWRTGSVGADGRFVSERSGTLDYGGLDGFYAPARLANEPNGRLLIWGWLTENARNGFPIEGYSGALSLPRVITADSDGDPAQTPAPELEGLRREEERVSDLTLDGGEIPLKTEGQAAEVVIRIGGDKAETANFSLFVRETPDKTEYTQINYDGRARKLTLDTTYSTLDERPNKSKLSFTHKKRSGGVELRVFVDGSVVEIFAGGETLTARVYPTRSDASRIRLSGVLPPSSLSAFVIGSII